MLLRFSLPFFAALLLLFLHNIYDIHRSIQFGEHSAQIFACTQWQTDISQHDPVCIYIYIFIPYTTQQSATYSLLSKIVLLILICCSRPFVFFFLFSSTSSSSFSSSVFTAFDSGECLSFARVRINRVRMHSG